MKPRWWWLWFLYEMMDTNDFFLRDLIKVRAVRLDIELHDSRSDVFHIKWVNKLIWVRIVGGTDVDDFPVESAWKGGEAFEGDVEGEGVEDFGGVVPDDDVVDVYLCHLARVLNYIIPLES